MSNLVDQHQFRMNVGRREERNLQLKGKSEKRLKIPLRGSNYFKKNMRTARCVKKFKISFENVTSDRLSKRKWT